MKKHISLLYLVLNIFYLAEAQKITASLKSIENKSINSINLNKKIDNNTEISGIFDDNPIYGISISGSMKFVNDASFIKIILVAKNSEEHLIFDGFRSYFGDSLFTFDDICQETCFLDSVIPKKIIIGMHNASLQIETINVKKKKYKYSTNMKKHLQKNALNQIHENRVKKINEYNKNNRIHWIAKVSDFSKLKHQTKKKKFGIDENVFMYGFEYYAGGFFHLPDGIKSASKPTDTCGFNPSEISNNNTFPSKTFNTSSTYIDEFDWREKHGANDSNSPYYDNDGTGWMTVAKDQSYCGIPYGTCYAFGPVGTTEAMINIYYNQDIDLDLAEQDIVSCSDSCYEPGKRSPNCSFLYIRDHGVVQESCYPYRGAAGLCNGKQCTTNLTKITNRKKCNSCDEEDLKKMIVEEGPVCGTV